MRCIPRLCASLWLIGGASAAEPVSRVVLSPDGAQIAELGWDAEGGDRAAVNLLKPQAAIAVERREGDAWKPLTDGIHLLHKSEAAGAFQLIVDVPDEARDAGARLVVPLNVRISATTVLPARIDEQHRFHLPVVVSAPGYGQMHVAAASGLDVTSEFIGSRTPQSLAWIIALPAGEAGRAFTLHFAPLQLAPPAGMQDIERWKKVRRGWFNMFQIAARWGDPNSPFSAPAGVLANNVLSDPVSICLFIYADAALFTPELAPGVSAMSLVGHTLDWWLEQRTTPAGCVFGYWNHENFLDANPSVLISAWDYAEATGDRDWLAKRIDRLERVAEYLAKRDVDGDGLVEAVQSGNAGTLIEPARSCSAYDAVNCGWKDAYCNALAYRAFRCMADLEKQLGRAEQQRRYGELADRLKAAYARALLNPETGLIAWWISQDGKMHDYRSPFINGLAANYGLVDAEQAKKIMRQLRSDIDEAGFKRFDLGVPDTLKPVRREDYLLGLAPGNAGAPARDDGTDTFQYYLNGGVLPGDALRYLEGLYAVGQREPADAMLDAMIARMNRGDVQADGFSLGIVNEYPHGGEFFTWDGKTCGYEGLLSHAYHFQQAALAREPELRARLLRPLANAIPKR